MTLATFSIKDQEGWNKGLAANIDPYGRACFVYAARWANLMEREIASGKKLEAIAKATSHEADEEGITGFMYSCAVSILSQVWVHGEELRRWHNLDIQIKDEGEKANEAGTVLNPALIEVK